MGELSFPLETERLVIRPLEPADAEALHAVWSDPRSERFTHGRNPPASVAETRALLEGVWGIFERESGDLVGDCELFEAEGEIELAYGLAREHWGKGYATEAGGACVRAAFEQLGLERVVADIMRGGNARSERVLEKLGFTPWRETTEKTIYLLKNP